jgi:subtilisin family serine protease
MANQQTESGKPKKPRKGATPLEEGAAAPEASPSEGAAGAHGASQASATRAASGREAGTPELEQSDPRKKPFTPETLDKTVIAIPLLKMLEEDKEKLDKAFPVIIDLNLEYPAGRTGARAWVIKRIAEIIKEKGHNKDPKHQGINKPKSRYSQQYLFAQLEGDVIRELVRQDRVIKQGIKRPKGRKIGPLAIYRIWPDFKVNPLIDRSISTVKADAAQTSFAACGEGIVWAVLDSGIDKHHPHFALHDNLTLKAPLVHTDFTQLDSSNSDDALKDEFGHGTHVAGIIAGEMRALKEDEKKGARKPGQKAKQAQEICALTRQRDEDGEVTYNKWTFEAMAGMAPKCKLLSLKVLDEDGDGLASNLIAAIALVQEINGFGRRLLIHGVNMSVGYDFEPEWFACGQSPLCVEVDRLVRSGVVVVVAAGNTGYGLVQSQFRDVVSAGMDLTINDPGNAELAITVGSTHKDMPHVYGVSYFSSKGPTGDGRAKPDLVAPGEKIISCAAGQQRELIKDEAGDCLYLEQSGTSMAAPHVSGAIASFLSIKREFIGQPERVKEIFLSTATDLKRERYFQGRGLLDLMRAIQSV